MNETQARKRRNRESQKRGISKRGRDSVNQTSIGYKTFINQLEAEEKSYYEKLCKELRVELHVRTKIQEVLLEQFIITNIKLSWCNNYGSNLIHDSENKANEISVNNSELKRLEIVSTIYEHQLLNRVSGLYNLLENHKTRVLKEEQQNGPQIPL